MTPNHQFDSDVLEDFKKNVPVKVLYDPKNPSEFVFEKQTFSIGFLRSVSD